MLWALLMVKRKALLFDHFSGADQRPRRGRSAGPDFSPMRNRGKNRLGRSPLRTSLGYEAGPASSLGSARHPCCGSWYCHHTRPPWAAGPMAGWFPRPGLPWPSGVPAAVSFCSTVLLRCGRGRSLPGPLSPWYCPERFGRGKPGLYAQLSKDARSSSVECM